MPGPLSSWISPSARRRSAGGWPARTYLADPTASILAPLAAGLLQMAIYRSREFDAGGAAELIGTGQPLAGALRRIDTMAHQIPMAVNPSQASAWIHNPLAEAHHPRHGVDMARLFSTHPATEERIARLMAMTPA